MHHVQQALGTHKLLGRHDFVVVFQNESSYIMHGDYTLLI